MIECYPETWIYHYVTNDISELLHKIDINIQKTASLLKIKHLTVNVMYFQMIKSVVYCMYLMPFIRTYQRKKTLFIILLEAFCSTHDGEWTKCQP